MLHLFDHITARISQPQAVLPVEVIRSSEFKITDNVHLENRRAWGRLDTIVMPFFSVYLVCYLYSYFLIVAI